MRSPLLDVVPREAKDFGQAQVLSRRGADIAFAGGGSSLLAVAGADERGGAAILIDSLARPASSRIARLHGHQVCSFGARIEAL